MWFTFPYRIKNPPEGIPYATFGLISLNILVYLFTTQYFLVVRQDSIDAMALTHQNLSVWRILTAMFLHENLLHIGGNMWFLWLFGAALEGRLRIWRYLALYFISGITGSLLHDVVVGIHNPDLPGFGASGAVMGLAGAYLYTFPYAPIRFFWFLWFGLIPRLGVAEVHAAWAALYLVATDIISGVLLHASDGVGHFVHIGGFAAGVLACGIMGVKRDTREYSEANAMKADLRDVDLLSYFELETMLQAGVTDVRVVTVYCEKALISPGSMGEGKCFQALQHFLQPLLQTGDQRRLASLILRLPAEHARQLPPTVLLQVASNLEHMGQYDYASRVYRRLYEVNPTSGETEAALNRAAHISQSVLMDPGQARHFYTEQIRLFPSGRLAADAGYQLSALPAPQRGPFI